MIGCILLAVVNHADFAHAVRLKDIVDIKGVRHNQMVGYGLVVGLNGTGDDKKSMFTILSMVTMLEKMGITVDQRDVKVENVAAVMVTANLPPFARAGSTIDVLVSSIGNAENLEGGTLLITPLKAGNGQVYAVAQGPVSTGGFAAGGAAGSVQKNFPTVGRVVNGATVEREVSSDFARNATISLMLRHPDFTTASRVSLAINTALGERFAEAPDSGTVTVKIPENYSRNVVEFVTLIEGLGVTPDVAARVIVNERTGTVVMGENVRISTVAVAHGNLSIQISESETVSQPLPLSDGKTVVSPETSLQVKEQDMRLHLIKAGVSISEIVRALNALGVTPRDLISIFQALKAAGALQATLEIL